jgi:hypothetical protein
MEHGAVSNDGALIAVGEQSSQHLLFNAALQQVLEVPPGSEYPHYACFSADDSVVALNSCHFYNGTTVGVTTTGVRAASSSSRVEPFDLYDGARVYAAVSRRDEFIIGDAAGYIRAFSTDGAYRWQHFIGSSVGDIDISAASSGAKTTIQSRIRVSPGSEKWLRAAQVFESTAVIRFISPLMCGYIHLFGGASSGASWCISRFLSIWAT